MSLRSPLGRVRGLGSAKEGTGHWYAERLTAVALVPLSIWFVASIVLGVGADYATVKAWMAVPGNLAVMILLVIAVYWHAALAIPVVIEDYVHSKPVETASLIAVRFACLGLAVFSMVFVLEIGLKG